MCECTHVCTPMRASMASCTCVCLCAYGLEVKLGQHSSSGAVPYFLKQTLSLGPITCLLGLASQPVIPKKPVSASLELDW